MNRKKQAGIYFFFDLFSAALAWGCLFVFRKKYIEASKFGYSIDVMPDNNLYLGLLLIPLFWTFAYYITGYYVDPYKKSRLNELLYTLLISLLGAVVLFFVLFIDDEVPNYKAYYTLLLFYAITHFTLTFIPRIFLTHKTAVKIHTKQIGFPTLILGSSDKAVKVYQDAESSLKSSGLKFIGFVGLQSCEGAVMSQYMPCLGTLQNIKQIIQEHRAEEIIIALESSEHQNIQNILKIIKPENVSIKIIPDLYDILSGQVKMSSILGLPLIEINQEVMPTWQKLVKRAMDVSISLTILILFFWLFILLAILIRLTSKGPAIYSHDRLGKFGIPFKIYKFRSMVVNAEENTPLLSSDQDPRITKIGRFLRKTRLDEIPQFFNVLKGDMSLVGPRPERQYFVNQLLEKAPHYAYLQKVRPGITSWGQVKFGYAQNVDEMLERLKYDLLYMENMSLLIDIKILIYTVLIVVQQKGK